MQDDRSLRIPVAVRPLAHLDPPHRGERPAAPERRHEQDAAGARHGAPPPVELPPLAMRVVYKAKQSKEKRAGPLGQGRETARDGNGSADS